MTKQKATKRALLLSALSLLMCVSMLIGSTFAWFTDSVTSGSNKIVAGTLKLDLELLDKETDSWNSIKKTQAPIFDYDLWEPGYTDVKVLKVENEGTLALKWIAKFISDEKLSILANVIDVYVKPSAAELTYPADRNLDGYEYVGTVAEFVNTIEHTTYGSLEAGESAYLGIALKMQESAGNDYQGLSLGAFDIQILATQDTVESDSFNNQYDKDATYPGITIPDDAIEVSDFEGFVSALQNGGNYEITAPFTVEGILNVAADTAFYNASASNVITFAQNARLKTAENTDLALYGIKIDGGGSFEMVDGEFTTDSTACNNNAILMAYAGSTLTLGEGTVVENVVSNCPAVAWAKGTVDNRATIIFDGATVRNCAGGSGTVINVDNYGDVYIEDGTVITGNVSYNKQNHGIIRIYNPWDAENVSTLTMNGGEITDNYFSANGAIGLYYGKMIMNGGEISGNSWYSYNGKTNGFYCVVYVHSQSQFIMNGGEISGNTITDGAINAINSSVEGAITINGGTVTNNINTRNDNKDALAGVCYPYSMQKTLVISEDADVTGTVYNHAIEGDVVVRDYNEITEYFGE